MGIGIRTGAADRADSIIVRKTGARGVTGIGPGTGGRCRCAAIDRTACGVGAAAATAIVAGRVAAGSLGIICNSNTRTGRTIIANATVT